MNEKIERVRKMIRAEIITVGEGCRALLALGVSQDTVERLRQEFENKPAAKAA